MRRRLFGVVLFLVVPALSACGHSGGAPAPIALTIPGGISLAPGSESFDQCVSFTLGNDEPLWVNSVAMAATPGFHHSNWFYVPDTDYAGPDGVWTCSTRNFDQLQATLAGGILFAQSTLATTEDQKFAPGAAIKVPAHSRVVGGLHLLNASSSTIQANMTLTLTMLDPATVNAHLSPMVFQYSPLYIEPYAKSRFYTSCPANALLGGPGIFDFDVYYVLPHYHSYGTGAHLQASGGPAGTQVIFDKASPIGTVLSESFVPPLPVSSQTTMEFSCDYLNQTGNVIGWGNGNAEMCIVVAWQNSGWRWILGAMDGAGGNPTNMVVGTAGDGTILNTATCNGYALAESS